MLLQRARLPESLSKYCLKPSGSVFRLPKFESAPLSPRCVFSFKDGAVSSPDEANDGRCCSHVPKGCFAVYVGKEGTMRRFVIPLSYLSQAIFKALLKEAEEEFGFSSNGGIRLPCESFLFEHILWLLKKKDPMVQNQEMVEELLSFYHNEDREFSS
ncbi:protein SMALL AUXIN UP-REGULATED RNA 9-like [Nymphaea colorata]|nr:protein SMALL AUXIN UP-REGULATED RNA 9-like [Nymphaea colorata]